MVEPCFFRLGLPIIARHRENISSSLSRACNIYNKLCSFLEDNISGEHWYIHHYCLRSIFLGTFRCEFKLTTIFAGTFLYKSRDLLLLSQHNLQIHWVSFANLIFFPNFVKLNLLLNYMALQYLVSALQMISCGAISVWTLHIGLVNYTCSPTVDAYFVSWVTAIYWR